MKQDFSYTSNETGDYRDTWRIFRIMAEFVEGYQFLNNFSKEVVVFGSARFREDHEYYRIARELGGLLARAGYTTITGGGPGIMEAANRGATDAGGESVGLNIHLPFEQRINPYVKKSIAFYYFFTRKVMMTAPGDAFIFFPGGFGTLDEFLEVADHIEIGKMCPLPIVLVGKKYWDPFVSALRSMTGESGFIPEKRMREWRVVDSAEEAMDVVARYALRGAEEKSCELSPFNFHSGGKNVDWRIFHIMSELVEGFEFLTGLVEAVTVLGTKSIGPESRYYAAAHSLGASLAKEGFSVVTGGLSGVAEAANKGCMEEGSPSYGIGMEVRGAARMNPYVTKQIMFKFPFTRKLIVTAPSKAFVFFPGGYGTLHHLFEVLTLIQTGKMQPVPVILYDHNFWAPLHSFIKETLVHDVATIADADDELYQIVDDEDSVIQIVKESRPKIVVSKKTKRSGAAALSAQVSV